MLGKNEKNCCRIASHSLCVRYLKKPKVDVSHTTPYPLHHRLTFCRPIIIQQHARTIWKRKHLAYVCSPVKGLNWWANLFSLYRTLVLNGLFIRITQRRLHRSSWISRVLRTFSSPMGIWAFHYVRLRPSKQSLYASTHTCELYFTFDWI